MATGNAKIVNNTFVDSSARLGPAVVLSGSSVFENNICVGLSTNAAAATASPDLFPCDPMLIGAYHSDGGGYLEVFPANGGQILSSLLYPAMQDYPPEYGVIASDPVFRDAANGDFRLAGNSPCVGAGNNLASISARDLDGNPRIRGRRIDLGAYERQILPATILFVK